MGDATSAVAELADLEALSSQLSQGYAGASLADIDEELLERALGRPAVDDLAALRQMERELERQGYLNRSDGRLELSPKAVRRLGPRRCAGCSPSSTPPAAATTTSPTPARPASSPAARGSGGSATSSRWTSSAR